LVDFPHNCFPGNSATNGGFMNGSGTTLYPYSAALAPYAPTDTTFTVNLTPNVACTSSDSVCCTPGATVYKIEFIINEGCRSSIDTITSTGPSQPLNPSYSRRFWHEPPAIWTSPRDPLVTAVPGLDDSGQSLDFTVTLKPNAPCKTVGEFLYEGRFWYAGFGVLGSNPHGCCGTALN